MNNINSTFYGSCLIRFCVCISEYPVLNNLQREVVYLVLNFYIHRVRSMVPPSSCIVTWGRGGRGDGGVQKKKESKDIVGSFTTASFRNKLGQPKTTLSNLKVASSWFINLLKALPPFKVQTPLNKFQHMNLWTNSKLWTMEIASIMGKIGMNNERRDEGNFEDLNLKKKMLKDRCLYTIWFSISY